MAIVESVGYLFIALGVPFSLFLATVVNDSLKVIVLVFSAFFWLLSLLFSSLLWFAVVPLQDVLAFSVPFAVIFQELSRFGLYYLFKRAQNGFKQISQPNRRNSVGIQVEGTMFQNVIMFAYVAGLGYGSIHAIVAMANVIADVSGPGTVGYVAGNYLLPLNSALTALIFALLHICWSVIFFDGCDKRSWFKIGYVIFSHMFVSCLTLLNSSNYISQPLVYLATTLPSALVLFASVFIIIRFVLKYSVIRANMRTFIHAPFP